MGAEKNLYDTDSRDGEGVMVEPAHGVDMQGEYTEKKPWWHSIKEPGSAPQIILAAAVAIGIGMAVNATVDEVPLPAVVILGIPGRLWLRALTAVVLPLIVCAMILAIQRLKEMRRGGGLLAKWTIFWYIITTIIAICHSILLTALVWRTLLTEVAEEDRQTTASQDELISERESVTIESVVEGMFDSIITNNIVNALATNALLAVLVVAIIVGYLIEDPNSPILALTREVERMITKVITFLIKLAPVGVFFLILSNIMRLDMASVGKNLGVLIGTAVAQMLFHLLVILPALYFGITRKNPYTMWFKCSKAWITAWGTASSAATLPVTLKYVASCGVPNTIAKFAVPLGCLVNMDGTAIYLPLVVVFLAQTQGIVLNAAEYIIVILLSTLAAIGVSPIPSASLVLIVMICGSVNVPVGGMYAVVVAIDWFLDRFRTVTNVSGDLFAAGILYKITKIEDPEDESDNVDQVVAEAQAAYNRELRV